MVKAIIFDCFGVLTIDDWQEFLATLPAGQVEAVSEINRAHDAGFLREAELIEEVQRLTGRNPRAARKDGNTAKRKNTKLLEYIAELKRSYKIGLLSNVGSNWIREVLLTAEEQRLFDAFVFSYETGLTKPNPQAFELMGSRLEVVLDECVFIDDIERNCTAAKELGMGAVLYESFPQMKTELERLLTDSKN